MFCPTCGQHQVAENSRFCSRCGFLLTGITEVIANNGVNPNQSIQTISQSLESPRKKGVKKGAWIILVGMLLIVPLLGVLHILTDTEPFLAGIATIISFFGGILRIIYALMFQDASPQQIAQTNISQFENQQFLSSHQAKSLPPQQSIPVTDYVAPQAGSWRDTNDFVKQPSVVDSTTKLLQKDDQI
jgi:hypothetical protein